MVLRLDRVEIPKDQDGCRTKCGNYSAFPPPAETSASATLVLVECTVTATVTVTVTRTVTRTVTPAEAGVAPPWKRYATRESAPAESVY